MKLSFKIARILVRLTEGESIPASSAKNKLIDILVSENILLRKGKHRKTIELLNKIGLDNYLANQLQIFDLEEYISALENKEVTRAELVRITTDSKVSKERAFKGFLVNSYRPVQARLNHNDFIIHPQKGSFIFIYDYETFEIPEDITVVGVENAKNFSEIHNQQYLFKDIKPLFISRYPQNQSKDFIRWMKSIPNPYLHFGDFDLAGIGIYLNEYKKHLWEKASFFIPANIKDDIRNTGNRQRFDIQKINYDIESIDEPGISDLIKIIQEEKKGLDQEFYIK